MGFPRIIGKSTIDTYSTVLDYFAGIKDPMTGIASPGTDKIAVTGFTLSGSLVQMFTAVYGGLQMTLEWNKVVSITKKGAGLAFSTDGKVLAVYCSQTSSPASLVVFDVANGAIINHFNYNNIENGVN